MERALNKSQIIVLIILVIFFILIAILNIGIRYLLKYLKSEKYIQQKSKKPTTLANILRVSKKYLFTPEERDLIWDICKKRPLPNFEFSIKDENAMEDFFKYSFNLFSTSEKNETEYIENQKTILLSIRDKLEFDRLKDARISSSTVLSIQQELFFITQNQDHFPIIILDNSEEGLFLSIPNDVFHNKIEIPPLSKINLFFVLKNKVAYSMTARFIRYETRQEKEGILVSHTNDIKALQSREHMHLNVNIPCKYSPVQVVSGGNKNKTQISYHPLNKKRDGQIIDLTGVSCELIQDLPIKNNQYIMIEAKINGESSDTIIGIISATAQSAEQGKHILHVRFVRMSKKTRNKILSRVYEYA